MKVFLGFLIAATAAACAPTPLPPGPQPGSDPLAAVGRWRLLGATDGSGQPLPAATRGGAAVHAVVFEAGAVAIEGGCNHMGGDYRIDTGGRLVVGAIQSTLMACADEALMTADATVAGLLQGTSEWRIAESYPEQLFLDHADGRRSQWVAVRPAHRRGRGYARAAQVDQAGG